MRHAVSAVAELLVMTCKCSVVRDVIASVYLFVCLHVYLSCSGFNI